MRAPLLALLGALSCSGGGGECPPHSIMNEAGECVVIDAAEGPVLLEGPRLLRRLSLDLRGTLPTAAELARIQADPDELEALTWEYLDHPAFEERLVIRLQERWHTRVDKFHVFYPEYPELKDVEDIEYAFERSVGEEPLRLVARVVAEDLPWSEVATADWTMANELLESIWKLERESTEPGWQVARYTDDRPAAGVLATNGLWWRYESTVTNYNRLRVAALMRLLICEDIQARPVSFAELPALADGDSMERALRETPYCMGCHSNIDPIAANLFGFWVGNEHSSQEIDTYHTEREPMGALLLDLTPAWYGTPTRTLAELGIQIAADPRFDRCAAESVARTWLRRDVELADRELVDRLLGTYLDEGGRIKPVIAALTATPEYRLARSGSLTEDDDAARNLGSRLMTADTLDSALQELSGFAWTFEGFDQLDNDDHGHRLLGGTVDGTYLTRPQATPSLTWALVLQRVAEAAASELVAHDLAPTPPAEARLLTVSRDTRPGDGDFEAQLATLALRLWGLELDEGRQDELSALWEELARPESGESEADAAVAAWSGLLVAMMRDPDFGSY